MDNLLSGKLRYPSHRWGLFAQNPLLDVGATGDAWTEALRDAWAKSGGSAATFNETFPQYAENATATSPLAK